MSEQGRGDTLVAFLLGGLVGAAVAVLLAPRSGKETRKRLQQWAEGLGEKGQDLWEEGRGLLQEGKEAVQDKAERLKHAFEKGKKAWDEGAN